MIKIKPVFVSSGLDFKMPEPAIRQMFGNYEYSTPAYVKNNRRPLGDVYNDFLQPDKIDYDYIAFIHADVEFNIGEFAKQLDLCHGKYDLIGLCGCAKIKTSQSPLNWYCGSIPFPEYRWGSVMHGELGGHLSFFSQHHPTVTDHEVACIDGLCLVLSKKAVQAGLRFDSTVGAYSHYDTDISFSAVMKYGFKVGVLVRPELKHYSVGKSILTQQFLEDEIQFRRKWNLKIPPNSPISQLFERQQPKVI